MSKNAPKIKIILLILCLFSFQALGQQTIILDVGPLTYEKLKTSTNVDQNDLELTNTITPDQALQQQNQIVVNKNAGLGRYATVFLQGSQSSHILNLKNNFRNSDPSLPSRVFNFGSRTHGFLDSLQVIQGPESLEYGTDALAGVIHMSQEFNAIPSYKADFMMGSYHTQQYKLQAQGPKIEWALSRMTTQGVSEVEGEDYEADGAEHTQIESAYKTQSYGVFRFSISHTTTELDDYITAPQDDPNYNSDDKSYGLNWQKTLKRHYHLGVSYQSFERHVVNEVDAESSKTLDEAYRAQSHQVYFKAKDLYDFLNYGIDYYNEIASLPNLSEQKSQAHYGLWSMIKMDITKVQKLSLGLRFYKMRNTEGLVYQSEYLFNFYKDLAFWTRLSSGFKAASLSDLYSPVVGNSALENESNQYIEAGVSSKGSSHFIKFLYFQNNYTDLIQYQQGTGLVNIGEAKIQGLELSYTQLVRTFEVTAFINYWQSENRKTGKRLTLRPEWVSGVSVGQQLNKFRYKLQAKYTGARLDYTEQSLNSYIRWDLYLNYRLNSLWHVYANALNIFNANAKWAIGYSSQPRELYAGVSYRF